MTGDSEPKPARVKGGLGGWGYWLVTIPIVGLVVWLIISLLANLF